MSTKEAAEKFNANTVLLTILLAISGWTLVTLLDVKDTVTKTVVRVDFLSTAQAADHAELQMRRSYQGASAQSARP